MLSQLPSTSERRWNVLFHHFHSIYLHPTAVEDPAGTSFPPARSPEPPRLKSHTFAGRGSFWRTRRMCGVRLELLVCVQLKSKIEKFRLTKRSQHGLGEGGGRPLPPAMVTTMTMTMRGGGTAEDRGPPCGAGRSRLRLGRRGGGKRFFFFSPGGGEVNVGPRPSFGPRGGGREAPWQPGPGALGAGAGPGRLGPGWPGAWREEAGPSWRVLLDSALPLSLSVRATATHRESPSASLPLPVSLCPPLLSA